MTLEAEKAAGITQKKISEIIQLSLKNSKIGSITATNVTVINDLSIVKICVSSLGQKPKEEAGMEVLDHDRDYLHSELVKQMTIRKVPELIFKLDNSLERGNKIEHIISGVNK